MNEIFISYSRRDGGFVDALKSSIERNGFSAWVDREDIRGGDAWRAEISRGIRECHSFIAVLSNSFVSSNSTTKELNLADKHKRPIIPVLYEQCVIPHFQEYQLAGLQMVDFSIQPFDAAMNELLRALGSTRGLRERVQLTQTERQELVLARVLPGLWQVQLNTPTPYGIMPLLMMFEIQPNGFFAGQAPQAPGLFIQGQWSTTQFNQLALAGTQTYGFQTFPYQTILQFTNVNHNQLNGFSSGGEAAFWQRIN
jgi:hypothetical protein